ncbi:hypothetical protein M9979_04160 [Sphingomonas sp. RP10(2022)]|uniref:Porin domain-containing protein n=1 Tax=Sphingomonas liriopis TaxID=2949094 RepID=A0A9X2HRE1_9SPHN|nr:hypothetical protein [Sphingomonas liriopis]MCP3734069.1 hypothetical protein [Sphingomonas liriopis]
MAGMMAVALGVTGVVVAPAFGAAERVQPARRPAATSRFAGSFTPAAADPRLAAAIARGGLDGADFRFTPAEARQDKRAVTVAVRARSSRTTLADAGRAAAAVQAPTVGIQPIAYNLGVSLGWKRFAVSGAINRVDLGPIPGSRESTDVALTYRAGRASSRVLAVADRPLETTATPKLTQDMPSYSVDVSSSYALTRNLDLTAGMRYRSDRERLTRVDDNRRDSQSVYVGTAFRF